MTVTRVVILMVEYSVLFAVKMTAKNPKDLERKAEKVGEDLSKHLRKIVLPYSYGEIVKKDTVEAPRPEEKLC